MLIINLFKKKLKVSKGISALEILLTVALLTVLLAVVIPQFSQIRERQVLKNAVSETVSSLHKAQSLTLASANSSVYGVHFQSDKVIIFTGTVYAVNNASNQIVNIVTPATISNVNLGGVSGASGDLYFNRLSGAPSTNGTITISTTSFSKIITVSSTGAVSVN